MQTYSIIKERLLYYTAMQTYILIKERPLDQCMPQSSRLVDFGVRFFVGMKSR